MAAVKQNWRALKHASDDLKNNAGIVFAAVERSGWSWECADAGRKGNAEMLGLQRRLLQETVTSEQVSSTAALSRCR